MDPLDEIKSQGEPVILTPLLDNVGSDYLVLPEHFREQLRERKILPAPIPWSVR